MRDGKSSCGFYYRRGLGNRAQSREPLRGYEPPGNRPPCAGWIPSSLSPSILPFHDVREWISCVLAVLATVSLGQRSSVGLEGRVNTSSSSRTRRLQLGCPDVWQ